MIRSGYLAVAILAASFVTGCAQSLPGTSRSLGEVEFASAFAASREVVSQYFSVDEADPATGVITSRPVGIEARNERLLGGSPARQLATIRLRREDGQVMAHASVAIQREGSASFRQMSPVGETYDGVPNQGPAEAEAATTPEQNELWQTERYDHALESKMLADIYRSLHPQAQ